MGDYIKIFRTYQGKRWRYIVVAFNEFDYEYMWFSPQYRWFWQARWLGAKAAHAAIEQGRQFRQPGDSVLFRMPIDKVYL